MSSEERRKKLCEIKIKLNHLEIFIIERKLNAKKIVLLIDELSKFVSEMLHGFFYSKFE